MGDDTLALLQIPNALTAMLRTSFSYSTKRMKQASQRSKCHFDDGGKPDFSGFMRASQVATHREIDVKTVVYK